MALTWESSKDPNEVKDYELDWSDRLETASDTISTSAWSIVTDSPTLVIDSSSTTTTVTKVWLSAGTDGTTYDLLNRVVTAGGRTYDQTVKLRVADH